MAAVAPCEPCQTEQAQKAKPTKIKSVVLIGFNSCRWLLSSVLSITDSWTAGGDCDAERERQKKVAFHLLSSFHESVS